MAPGCDAVGASVGASFYKHTTEDLWEKQSTVTLEGKLKREFKRSQLQVRVNLVRRHDEARLETNEQSLVALTRLSS